MVTTDETKKVRVMDILNIRKGCSREFRLDSYASCISGKNLSYQVARTHPRLDVKNYKCSINAETSTLTISAVARDDEE